MNHQSLSRLDIITTLARDICTEYHNDGADGREYNMLRGAMTRIVAGNGTPEEDETCGNSHVVRGVVEVLCDIGFKDELKKYVAQLDDTA